jgi:GDPmannose 4,6-dehydratase
MKKSDDYVIATEKQYTVKKFIELTCKRIGFEINWFGKKLKIQGRVSKIYDQKLKIKKNQNIVKINKRFFRPNDVNNLLGDSSKAKKILKWKPEKNINLLIKEMVEYDLGEAKREYLLKKLNKIN